MKYSGRISMKSLKIAGLLSLVAMAFIPLVFYYTAADRALDVAVEIQREAVGLTRHEVILDGHRVV
jgi:hypothetical protein